MAWALQATWTTPTTADFGLLLGRGSYASEAMCGRMCARVAASWRGDAMGAPRANEAGRYMREKASDAWNRRAVECAPADQGAL